MDCSELIVNIISIFRYVIPPQHELLLSKFSIFLEMKLSILVYMKYLGGSEHSKCVVEGENVLNAGHLILAGKIQETSCSNFIDVYGLCLQSSALDSNPHEITGRLSIASSVKIINMLCSCKAGNSGKCKHISAFLIRIIRCVVKFQHNSFRGNFNHYLPIYLITLFI